MSKYINMIKLTKKSNSSKNSKRIFDFFERIFEYSNVYNHNKKTTINDLGAEEIEEKKLKA